MSYQERKGEPHGTEFTVTVTDESDFSFTWTGYADLPHDALGQAESEYWAQREELFPESDYDGILEWKQ